MVISTENLPEEWQEVVEFIALALFDQPPSEREAVLVNIVRVSPPTLMRANPTKNIAECRAIACLLAVAIEDRVDEFRAAGSGRQSRRQ